VNDPSPTCRDADSQTRFLVDGMCGGVLTYLRMCGHDAVFAPDRALEADDAVADAAREEQRTVITRDRDLAALAGDAVLLRAHEPEAQLEELAAAGVDFSLAEPPERCGRCNGSLESVPDSETTDEYAPDPADEPVWRCVDCGQYFWKGSHWERVVATLETL
jgi:uncharacterized protein with PIN domain